MTTAPGIQPAPTCPGCLGSKPALRLICLACRQVLPERMGAELDRTADWPITDRLRAVVEAEALTWLRVRREGRHA